MEAVKKFLRRKHKEPVKSEFTKADYDKTYKYAYKVMRFVQMRIEAINPSSHSRTWHEVLYWIQFVNLVLSISCNLLRLQEVFASRDINKIFRMLPCLGYLVLGILKSYKMILQRPVFENLVNELRDMWPTGSIPPEDRAIVKKALKELNILLSGYYVCNYLLGFSFIAPSYLDIIKRAAGHDTPKVLPYLYWTPYDDTQPGYFEFTLTMQAWHTMITLWFMLCGDLLFCIFLSHISMQFDLLSTRIRRLIYVPIDKQLIAEYPLGIYSNYISKTSINEQFMPENENIQTYELEMRDIIRRHKALIRLANDVEDLFSFAVFFNFLYGSLIICFCGFCVARVEKVDEFMYKSFLTTALAQLWLLCWFGQKLLDSSTGMTNALYDCGWYKASNKVKISILIMMHRAQKDVHVTTYGFSVISLASYTTIIKTAWSYLTLLLNSFDPDLL